jgi:hypothetical protein
MEVDGIGSSSGEGIEGGGGKQEEVEGKLRKQEEEGLRTLGVVVVVACLFLESFAATKATAQLICFACSHTPTTTRLVLLQ